MTRQYDPAYPDVVVDRTDPRLDEPSEFVDEPGDATGDGVGDEISDEELTRLALAADPEAPIDDDAVPFGDRDPAAFALLPDWYMPAPSLRRSPWRALALLGIAATLVIGTIGGFCVTYGIPEFVWN